MAVGKNLKAILKDSGMTIKELADLADIPINTLYSITKRDSGKIDVETMRKITSVLKISSEDLMPADEMRREGLIQTGAEIQATTSLYLAYGFKMEKTEDGEHWVVTDGEGHSTTLTVREWQDYVSNRVRDIKVFALYLHEKLMKDIKGEANGET